MKRRYVPVVAILALFCVLETLAELSRPITFLWDASPDASVSGYAFYISTNPPAVDSGNFLATNDAPMYVAQGTNTSAQVSALAVGIHYFAYVTAHDTNGITSPISNVLPFFVPSAPTNLRFAK